MSGLRDTGTVPLTKLNLRKFLSRDFKVRLLSKRPAGMTTLIVTITTTEGISLSLCHYMYYYPVL